MSKYIEVYEAVSGEKLSKIDDQRADIIKEMRAVRHAKTLEEAVKVIAWWDAWPNDQHKSAFEFCREVRSRLRRLFNEPAIVEPDDRQPPVEDNNGDAIPMQAVLLLIQERLYTLEKAVRNLLDSVNARYPEKNPRKWACYHMAELDRLVPPKEDTK